MSSFCNVQSRRKKYYIDLDFLKVIGTKIRHFRKLKKMTLEDLAFACNDIDYAYINKIELGQINLSVSYLKLIAEKLNVSIQDLTGQPSFSKSLMPSKCLVDSCIKKKN